MKIKWLLITGIVVIVILAILGIATGNANIVIGGIIGISGSFITSIANMLEKEKEIRDQRRRDVMHATLQLVKIKHDLKEKHLGLTNKELDFNDLKKTYIDIYNQFMKELSKE